MEKARQKLVLLDPPMVLCPEAALAGLLLVRHVQGEVPPALSQSETSFEGTQADHTQADAA